jgi:bifunctional DNA-binding transcriptional regulator/antitoxin component of YhaV-PrlF toxin-antitoxin module
MSNQLLGKPRRVDGTRRVTLPKEVLDVLDVASGDTVFFKLENRRIVLGKVIKKYEYVEAVMPTKDH